MTRRVASLLVSAAAALALVVAPAVAAAAQVPVADHNKPCSCGPTF